VCTRFFLPAKAVSPFSASASMTTTLFSQIHCGQQAST
jgi:hypothetical protein